MRTGRTRLFSLILYYQASAFAAVTPESLPP